MTPIVNVKAFKCNKCGWIWISRPYLEDSKTKPIACAKCKSPYWERDVVVVAKDKEAKKKKK